TPTICSVSGTSVTALAVGSCTVAANQAGNASYAAAPQVTQNLAIGQASQSISFGSAPSLVYGGTATVSASATSNLPVSFSSTTPTICSVSGSTVTALAVGSCTVAANQAGNASYAAAPQVTQNLSVGQASQSISFGSAPSLVYGGTATVSATATSNLPVSFSSTTPTICSVSGTTVTALAVGSCTVAANQAGNASYAAAPQVTQNLSVGQASQSISFGSAPSLVVGGTGTISATGGASGNAVTLASTTTGVCTLSGSVATGVSLGTCIITANQAGNANYSSAPQVSQSIVVSAGPPGAPSIVAVTPGNSQATVQFNPPASANGSAIIGYTASCTPSGGSAALSATGATSPIIVTGLSNGTTYACSVLARNAVGAGPSSATVNVSLARVLSSLSISGPAYLDENSGAAYSLVATFDNGFSTAVSGSFSLDATPYASLSGATLTAGSVVSDQLVTLGASYTEAGVTKVASLSVTIRKALIELVPGWNLIGNATATALDVQTLFGDPGKVTSVFKWLSGATPGWAFYTPTLADGGAAYAQSKGYQALASVNGGEGFWVNAKLGFSLPRAVGIPVTSAEFQDVPAGANPLPAGWSLIAVADYPSPRAFANAISLSAPVAGTQAATSLISLWAWYPGDTASGTPAAWYFYAPSLDNSGTLAGYAAAHSYLDFLSSGKFLDPATGFWVNRP
ncbi:MAG: fibronectin type III domain-containing protein, partial [Rhodocyclaceae bacterium]|nr:fibronectin type III domain-containing protein [Rhodocyclaceae bacterium]